MLTIIMPIWNEAYLLPWWLRHHVPLADHGIIFDYGSNDGSVELCKALAPGWDVRQSRNRDFAAIEVDREVMDAERNVDGWKIVLNVTEFLVGDVARAMQDGSRQLLESRIIVDPPILVDVEPDPHQSLVQQRTGSVLNRTMRQPRLLHCESDGNYSPGRHFNEPISTRACEVWWYGFSPWTPRFRARKLQIQQRIPQDDRDAQRGWHHIITEAGLAELFHSTQQLAGIA